MREKLNANAQAILDIIRATDMHPTATEIYDEVRKVRPQIGLATVYRILRNLVQHGYVLELKNSDESCRYDGHITRHDHAICTECGALLDVPIDVPLAQEILQNAALAAGIQLQSHEVRLYGRCPACQARQKGQESHTIKVAL
jgi:Fe2+ or Zn2+ uptake regulation protein